MQIKYNRETEYYEAHIFGFPAGINQNDEIIRDGQATDAQNIFLDGNKRGGSAKVNSTTLGASAILGVAPFYVVGSASKWLLAAHDTKVYRWTGTAFSSIKTGLTTAKEMEFQAFNKKIYMVNGQDGYFEYDGTTYQAVPAYSPTADEIAAVGANVLDAAYTDVTKNWQIIALLDTFLFLAGNSTHPSTAFFTYIDPTVATGSIKPGYLPGLYYVDFRTNDNEGLVAAIPYAGDLVFFKESSLFRLLGNSFSTFRPLRIEGAKGTPARRSPAVVGYMLYYLTKDDGVYAFDGNTPMKVLQDLDPLFQSINQTYISKACGVEWKGRYWLAVPEGADTTNKTVVVYDPANKGYTVYRYPFGITAFTKYKFSDTEVLCAATADGFVYKLETGTDDAGADIDTYVEWTVGVESAEIKKKPIKALVTCEGGVLDNATVVCTVDGGTPIAKSLGTGAATIPTMYKSDPFGASRGYTFKIKVRHNGTGSFKLTKAKVLFVMAEG